MTTLSKDEIMRLAHDADDTIRSKPFTPEMLAFLERFATLCRADLVAENKRLKREVASMPIIKDERDALRERYEYLIVEIGKLCGEDLSDEPRMKWVIIAVAGVVAERDALQSELNEKRENIALDAWKSSQPVAHKETK